MPEDSLDLPVRASPTPAPAPADSDTQDNLGTPGTQASSVVENPPQKPQAVSNERWRAVILSDIKAVLGEQRQEGTEA